MRSPELRALLSEISAAETPALAQERADWARVRSVLEEVCSLDDDEAARRLVELRVSPDPLQRRAAELADARTKAAGFLEPMPQWPPPANGPQGPAYEPGKLVGRYRIESVIGEGGMGRVYRATDTQLLRPVALKVFTNSGIRGASVLREAQMAARLHHPDIATVYDVLDVEGRLHIVMEYLDGRPLSAALAEGPLDVTRIVAWITRILAAVSHAHQAGVIHCDLKPANVFVLHDDRLKVLDFGLARLNEPAASGESSMAVAGTPRYMAPERVLGGHPDVRADIYSLGVMLTEMLSVVPSAAFDRPSAPTALPANVDGRVLSLRQVAATASIVDPARRYSSAAEMAAAVEVSYGAAVEASHRVRAWPLAFASLIAALAVLIAALALRPNTAPQPGIVAVRVTARTDDAVSSHIAAAMQQVLEHSLSGVRGLTTVRAPASGADGDDLDSTHRLEASIERIGQDVAMTLVILDRSGTPLAKRDVKGPLSSISNVATSVVEEADAALKEGGVRVTRLRSSDAARFVESIDATAFDEYAQAREYMRSPDVPRSLDYAIALLSRAVARSNGFGLGYAGLAEAYWQKYQNTQDVAWTDKARAAALDAVRLAPDDAMVRYTLALIYDGMGRREEAFVEVSKAISLQPANDDFFRLRGQLHDALGRRDRALEDFQTAIRLRPGYWENHRALGLAFFDAGQYDSAVASFKRETELRPSSPSAFQALGTAYQASGRDLEAIAAYETALKIRPSANSYANLGMLQYTRRDFEAARTAYEKSVELKPKNAVARRNLGDTLQKLGREREARVEYELAIVLTQEQLAVNPADVDLLSLQVLCHAKLRRKADTERLVRQLLAAERLPPAARYRTGVALVLIGNASGVDQVVEAIAAGYSPTVAAEDDDLEAVRDNPVLRAALDRQRSR